MIRFFLSALATLVAYEVAFAFLASHFPEFEPEGQYGLLLVQLGIPALLIACLSAMKGVWKKGASENLKVFAALTMLFLPPVNWVITIASFCFILRACV